MEAPPNPLYQTSHTHIVVDDVMNMREVQPTSGHVRRQQNSLRTACKPAHNITHRPKSKKNILQTIIAERVSDMRTYVRVVTLKNVN